MSYKKGGRVSVATTDVSRDKNSATSTGGYKDRPWIPRFWDGMNLTAIWRVLSRNRFRIHPICWGMALIISGLAVMNSALWLIQSLIFGRRIAKQEVSNQPVFIIGHWRSGTTLLHELLVLDRRHTFPNTYACFAPNHYLLTRRVFPPLLNFLMPARRPMDNMAAGWDRPQEDEFALCNMGLPSPYLTLAFPNEPPQDPEYLDMQGLAPEAVSRWKEGLRWFLKCLTVVDPRRIVLKSPPHTARIKTLLEAFPDARFVHIVRDPFVLFPSTVNLWKRLSSDQGMQVSKNGFEEYVYTTLVRMYEAFEREKPLIPPSRFCEVRYEDLTADMIGQMRRIYEELDLGGFDQVLPALEEFVASQSDYKKNRYQISPETRAEIARRWEPYFKQYGYGVEGTNG